MEKRLISISILVILFSSMFLFNQQINNINFNIQTDEDVFSSVKRLEGGLKQEENSTLIEDSALVEDSSVLPSGSNIRYDVSQEWVLGESIYVEYQAINTTVKDASDYTVDITYRADKYLAEETGYGDVFFGIGSDADTFYIVTDETEEIVAYSFPSYAFLGDTLGTIVLSDNINDVCADNGAIYVSGDSSVSRHLKNGTVVWETAINAPTPAYHKITQNSTHIFTSGNNYFYCHDKATGTQQWSADPSGISWTYGLSNNNTHLFAVRVGEDDVDVYDALDGSLEGTITLDVAGQKYGIDYYNDHLYVGMEDYFYKFDMSGNSVDKFGEGEEVSLGGMDAIRDLDISTDGKYLFTSHQNHINVFRTLSADVDLISDPDYQSDDGDYATYSYTDTKPIYSLDTTMSFDMYDLVNPDNAYADLKISVVDDGLDEVVTASDVPTVAFSDTATYGSSELRVTLEFSTSLIGGYTYSISIFDTGLISYTESSETTGSATSITGFTFEIDYLWCSRDVSSGDFRSERLCLGDVYQHRLSVPFVEYRQEADVYSPLSWNFSSITPFASTSYDGYNLVISDTIPLTYEILFTSGVGCGQDKISQKQYLAISQFKSYDFEGSGGDNLNSTIVSSGAFSERKTSGNLNFEDDDLPEGYYYADVDCYIETAPTAVVLQYYDGSSWINATSASVSITDRWQQLFAYLHPTGVSSGYTIRLVIDGSGIVFYDDINFNTVNHQVETTSWRKIKGSGHYRNLDGYSNPVVSSQTVYVGYWDRTAGTEITSTSVVTDSNGKFEWTLDITSFPALQESREVEFRSYASGVSSASNYDFEIDDFDTYFTQLYGVENRTIHADAAKTGSYGLRFGDEGQHQIIGFNYPYSSFLSDEYAISFSYKKSGGSGLKIAACFRNTSGTTDSGDYLDITTSWQESSVIYLKNDIPNGYYCLFSYRYLSTYDQYTYIDNYLLMPTSKSYFTPVIASDFPFYYETDPINNEFDFSEDTFDSWVPFNYFDENAIAENGYFYSETESGASYARLDVTGLSIEASVYDYFSIRIKANKSTAFRVKDAVGNELGNSNSITSSYTVVNVDASEDGDWTGTESGFYLICYEDSVKLWIDYIRLVHRDIPSISTADSYAWMSSTNTSFVYRTEIDNNLQEYNFDLDPFLLNLTTGSHSLNVTPFYDFERPNMVFIPGESITGNYEVIEEGIMKIIIHDQSGKVIDFDSFKTYIDSTRLYDNYLYFSNTSQTFNLTITDLFDNMLYQDTSEAFEEFKEIQLTLHSVKVQNLQENPIWLEITRDSKTFSEWVYPYEIVKYRLEAATYGFKVYYCDSLTGDLGAFSTNGSWVNFEYAVSADTALMVTGETIQDVFNNVISLTQDLDSVNTSMHIAFEDQSQNFTLQFTATNQNITFMLGNSSLIIDTINSNFTAILGDLILLDSNINGNFTTTFLAIAGNTTLLVNQLNSNFTDMQGLIISNNTVLYTQLVHTLADLAELKGLFTVHFDFVDGIGIGLSWETFKLYLNDSRQYGQQYYTPNRTQIRLKTFDYFNVSLDSANYTINNSCDISIIVDVFEVIFRNNNSQFKSVIEITRGGQSLVLFIEPQGSISHRFTEGQYTLNVSYIVETEIDYEIKNPDNYTVGVHNLFKSSFSIGSQLKLLDTTLSSNIVDVGAPDPKPTILGIVQLQIATAFFFGVILASCFSVLISYIFKTRVIQPIDETIDFSTLRKGVQRPIVETSSGILEVLPLTERKHVKASQKKDNRRR